jgi:hypothetical protein
MKTFYLFFKFEPGGLSADAHRFMQFPASLLLLIFSTLPLFGQSTSQPGRTRNPHGPLKLACERCHATTSWRPIRPKPDFHHDEETRYPLRGMHREVACMSCHASSLFRNVGTRCADCHADIHRRQFGARCEDCHTVRGWKVAVKAVQEHLNRFPLLGAHAAVNCESCHRGAASGVFTGLSTECVSCHRADYENTTVLNHAAASLPATCETCHTVNRWSGARFDHAQLAHFELTGAHARLECNSCHSSGRFKGTPSDCFGCHVKEFAAATNPNHSQAGFPKDCTQCHTTTSWTGARFDHNTNTRFALTGAHASVNCGSCHVAGRFAGTPTGCAGCHSALFEATTNPDHQRANFSTTCESCHTTTTWQGAKFDHSISRFPLTGAHITVSCSQCHVGGKFTGIATDCVSCHETSFRNTTNPNHLASGFSTNCQSCHTTQQWKGAKFDHSQTRFPLTGAHGTVTCSQCHTGSSYTGASAECAACHLQAFQGTTNPGHVAAGFPQDCTLCHTTVQWKGAKFDHYSATRFPLTGAHITVNCTQCHAGNKFVGTSSQCIACHQTVFQATTSPSHVAAGFSQDCTICHTTVQWKGAKFDHSSATRFPLTGAHINVACQHCHVNNHFAGTAQDCLSCHLNDFNRTTNPNHAAAGLPKNCETCHTTQQWKGARFDHNAATRFALTGAHVTVACSQCHVNNRFSGTPADCASCHLDRFNRTTNPNHAAAGFPTDCALCHTTSGWTGAKFNHAATRFPLTGAHVTVNCATCHVNGKYAGLGTSCVTCHLTSYNQTTNPNHASAGFPTDCQTCHNTTQWLGAVFDHSRTRFPLTGVHTTVQCGSCHVGGRYAGTPTDCYSCHRKEYETVTNPNHLAAGFPKTCESCHSTTTWTGAVFNHNFPIYTGKHKGKWTTCNDCHTNASNYTVFSCLNCHAHAQTKMDDKHKNITGYAYNSLTCYSCHPRGTK